MDGKKKQDFSRLLMKVNEILHTLIEIGRERRALVVVLFTEVLLLFVHMGLLHV